MSDFDELLTAAHVWHLDPHQFDISARRNACFGLLSEDERERYELFRTDAAQRAFLLTRLLCRATLSRYAGVDLTAWRFAQSENGKPSVAEPVEFRGLHFNLTHTEGLIACAVTRIGQIGVDAEETSRAIDGEGIARHFLSEAEGAEIERLPPQDRDKRIFELWVLKEAYLKGVGSGLMQSPETFTIQSKDDGNIIPLEGWQLALHRPTLQHVAATAVRAEAPVSVRWHTCTKID